MAEDHPVYREGLARAIKERPELELVGVASEGRSALHQIREDPPDVAVLDIEMDGLGGDEVLRAVRRQGLPTAVLIVSASTDDDLVYLMLTTGAQGYLAKSVASDEICEAVMRIFRGETVLGREIQGSLVKEVARRHERDPSDPRLTERENQVLGLIADGLSAPAIGEKLYISPATVKGHLHSLYEKLGVTDRAAAVATAMRRGYLS